MQAVTIINADATARRKLRIVQLIVIAAGSQKLSGGCTSVVLNPAGGQVFCFSPEAAHKPFPGQAKKKHCNKL
jgi:hypothetical protein